MARNTYTHKILAFCDEKVLRTLPITAADDRDALNHLMDLIEAGYFAPANQHLLMDYKEVRPILMLSTFVSHGE